MDSPERNHVRDYLLGNLNNSEMRRRVEEKLLLDDEFAEALEIAEDELIEEYLDGDFTTGEKALFMKHFLISEERKEKLQLIQSLKDCAEKSKTQYAEKPVDEKATRFGWLRLTAFPAMRYAALVLLLIGGSFAVWRVFFYQSEVDKGLVQLRLAYRSQRPIEARTTANFEYSPLTNTRGESLKPADEIARRRAENSLLNAAEDVSNSKAHQGLGLLFLTERKFDQALKEFNLALSTAPKDAGIYSDIGAVYLEKAKQAEAEEKFDESMEGRARSLEFLNRALEIDPALQEALFNKALVLQKLSASEQAREAWEKYLEKDSVSPWAEEARKNLNLLKQQVSAYKDKSQILSDFLVTYRNRDDSASWRIVSQTKELITGVMVQQQLTRKFLEASRRSQGEEVSEFLSALIYLGELEKQNAGDTYFEELADYYAKTNQPQREMLLIAHDELQKGHELILETDFPRALESFSRAKELFKDTGNVWENLLAEYRICYYLSRTDRIKESNRRLIELEEACRLKNYKWLQTLAGAWAGETYFFLGEYSKAIVYNEKALELAEECSDNYNTHQTLIHLTEIYKVIGDERAALNFTYRNLSLPDSYYASVRQEWRDLNYATETLHRFKFYDAAIALGEESAGHAQNKVKDDWMARTSHRNLAMIYGDLLRFHDAFREAERSLRISEAFVEGKTRKRLISDSIQTLADLQRKAGDCLKAVENYGKAIRDNEGMEFNVFKYGARKGLLLCSMARKNDAMVKEELPKLIALFDNDREKITDESSRNIFFDNEQEVYDAAIDYTYSELKDADQSFNYAENSRARSLLQLIRGNSANARPLLLSDVREQIPHGVQLLYYSVLPDKVLIWLLSKKRFITAEKLIVRQDLENKISEYRKALLDKAGNDNTAHLAKELYQTLIEPVEASLEKDKTICIVADKILFQVPFASLVSPATDKYLIEDYATLFAPSATVFVEVTKIAEKKDMSRHEAILSVGNPTFLRKDYPGLADLPEAKREAEEVASLYSSSKIFVSKEAVKERFVENLNDADVVHFAGHYVLNAKSPSLSKIILASGDLPVEEMMSKKLLRPGLMILSACETGIERFYNGEGMIGAARAFLAADVPLVVASQWAVDSDATADLMVKFHRYRKLQKLPTPEALRRAQVDLLSGENPRFRKAFYWAGFLPIGGYTSY